MDKLINEFNDYVINKVKLKYGVLGQADAGKSSLINLLTNNKDAYVSSQTDATMQIDAYDYENRAELIDFPGVGTTHHNLKKYKRYIDTLKLDRVLYIFSSKIKDVDMKVIEYLAKKDVRIIFVFNKVDSLTDVSGQQSRAQMEREKDLELEQQFKKYIQPPMSYIYTSVLTNEGIDQLKETLREDIAEKEEKVRQLMNDDEMINQFITYKTNTLIPKIFAPSFKDIIMSRKYENIEQSILKHYHLKQNDNKITSIDERINTFKQKAEQTKSMFNINQLLKFITPILKLKKLKPIFFMATILTEAGVKDVVTIIRSILAYVGDAEHLTKKEISNHTN